METSRGKVLQVTIGYTSPLLLLPAAGNHQYTEFFMFRRQNMFLLVVIKEVFAFRQKNIYIARYILFERLYSSAVCVVCAFV